MNIEGELIIYKRIIFLKSIGVKFINLFSFLMDFLILKYLII